MRGVTMRKARMPRDVRLTRKEATREKPRSSLAGALVLSFSRGNERISNPKGSSPMRMRILNSQVLSQR